MKKTLIILITTLILFSCKHELERPNWDVDMILPLAKTEMTIKNMLSDSSVSIMENNEGFINLVYEESFIDIDLDTFITIDAIADEQTHTLDSSSFDDVIIADTATLKEALDEAGLIIPNAIFFPTPNLPNLVTEDTITVDASEYFKTMTLYKGMLIIEINNGYPVDISNISLTLINPSNQNSIATFFFPIIPSGSAISDSASIAGQTLDENLLAILHNMDVNESSGAVLINHNDAVITKIIISDIGVTEATAIFPEQQLTETLKEHSFNMGSAKIKEIKIKEGTVTINALSTLPNGKMIYNIPSLIKDGVPFTTNEKYPNGMIVEKATSSTDLTTVDFDFTGYTLDLTGQQGRLGGDTINTIYTEAYTFIDSTGILETINHTDSFYSFIEFDITPEYAIGYMGNDTIEIETKENNLDIFNNINASNFELNEATLKIEIDNYIGADLQIDLTEIKGKNNQTNNEATLINNQTINIERGTLENNNLPINPTTTELIIPAEDFISILPNKVTSTAKMHLNPNGETNQDGFFYPEYPIDATLSIDIPLSLIAEDLTFIDTTSVTLPNSNEYIIEKIFLKVDNGLPFDATLQLVLLDENDLVIDTLLKNGLINAGEVDNNHMIINNTTSNLEIDYNDFQDVRKMVSISSFTTKPIDQFIDIYSHYKLDITLSAKINKTIGE